MVVCYHRDAIVTSVFRDIVTVTKFSNVIVTFHGIIILNQQHNSMSAVESSLSDGHTAVSLDGWRIKLYELETTGAWLDKGTGYVTCKQIEELGGPALQIVSEDAPGLVFFRSKIQSEDVYELQGENIIIWREHDTHRNDVVDYALSFQDTSGCHHLWTSISEVRDQYTQQREYGYSSNSMMLGNNNNSNSSYHRSYSGGRDYESSQDFELDEFSYDAIDDNNLIDQMPPKVLPTDFDDDNCLQRIRYLLENPFIPYKELSLIHI